MDLIQDIDLKPQFHAELTGNLLPFWLAHTVDEQNGGFVGALTNDLRVLNDAPRSAVLYARILWTYAAAWRELDDERWLGMAKRAYDYLVQHFWDAEHGGVYWSVDPHGRPLMDRKHAYANAFALYGLAEYHRATGSAHSLELAQAIYRLLEAHTFDPTHGGYIEGCARNWAALDDLRLSDKEPNCRKSMNTLLHLLEAYTNLLRVWEDAGLRTQLRGLIEIFLSHVIDPATHHFHLFFDDAWNTLPPHKVSYGHDIEGSWLLVEAAEALGDEALIARTRDMAAKMAQAVYDEGLDPDGAVINERENGHVDYDRHWWVQAEAVVGFYNAYQLTGQTRFAQASQSVWQYIQGKFVDRAHGEWFKIVHRDGTPNLDHVKTGPWECPYHTSRMCFEMLRRLG